MKQQNHATDLDRSSTRDRSPVSAIGQLLSPEYILLDLDVLTKKRVFEEVGRLLEKTTWP